MIVKEISLENFRNIQKERVEFATNTNLLIGQNGQGKTNILEAVYYLTTGYSFKAVKTQCSVINYQESFSKLCGKIGNAKTQSLIEIRIDKKKTIRLNGSKVFAKSLYFPVVLFEPASLDALKGSPDTRRKLIDRALLLDSSRTLDLFLEFGKALRIRNKLLKNARENIIHKNKAKALLDSADPIFLELANKICVERINLLEKIMPKLSKCLKDIASNKKEQVRINYFINKKQVTDPKHVFPLLKERANHEKEMAMGYSLAGPQTDDLEFEVDGKSAKFYLSQGEQRALVLAFKIALVYHLMDLDKRPLLLLDDVFSELDSHRREYLAQTLKRVDSQILITASEVEKTMNFERIFLVKNGRISKI